jgi:hypothetical protein
MAGRVMAQNADTLIYRSQSVRSVGVGFPAINYSLLSPLNHSGYSLNFHSTRFLDKPEYLTQFRMHFELGLLYNHANDLYITSLGFNGGWSRHWYTSDRTRPFRLMLGLGADAGVNIYMKEDNTNNPLAYFFNLSVCPDILLKYKWLNSQKTKFELGQQIYFPIGSLISSSEYSSTLPYGFTEKDAGFFDAMRLVSFGSFRKCATITTLDITPALDKRQKWPVLRISYMFSGMNYKNGDFTIKSADHLILFGAIFHLFR